jgi:hypothetical protein
LPWLVEHGHAEKAAVANGAARLGSVFAVALGGSAAGVLWAWPLEAAAWLAPGLAHAGRVGLGAMLQIAGLGLPLLCLSAVTQAILNAPSRFGWAAGADAVMKAVLVGGVVLAEARQEVLLLAVASAGVGVRAIAGAMVTATAAKLILLWCLLPSNVRRATALQARAGVPALLGAFGVTCAACWAIRSATAVALGGRFHGAALVSTALFAAAAGAVFFTSAHLLARRAGQAR